MVLIISEKQQRDFACNEIGNDDNDDNGYYNDDNDDDDDDDKINSNDDNNNIDNFSNCYISRYLKSQGLVIERIEASSMRKGKDIEVSDWISKTYFIRVTLDIQCP
jgi:hypothetical protein